MPKILPPNDPQRPEWTLLAKLIGNEENDPPRVPESADDAATLMKKMLALSWENDPSATLRLLAGRTVAHQAEKFQLNGHSRVEFETEITSRLTNRTGRETTEKNPTNNAITSWDPVKGGLVSYMRGRVGFVIGDMLAAGSPVISSGGIRRDNVRQQTMSVSSLNYLQDVGGVDFSAQGRIVRPERSFDQDAELFADLDQADEEWKNGVDQEAAVARTRYEARLESTEELTQSLDYERITQELADKGIYDFVEETDQAPQEELDALDAADGVREMGLQEAAETEEFDRIRNAVREVEFSNPMRPDISWIIDNMGAENRLDELTPENRILEMRNLALTGIDALLNQHEDYETFREVIAESFDPSHHFLTDPHFSDILEAAIDESVRMRGEESVQSIAPSPELLPAMDSQQQDSLTIGQAEQKFEALGLALDLAMEMGQEHHQAQTFDPNDPERPDLRFLRNTMGDAAAGALSGYAGASPAVQTYVLAQEHLHMITRHLPDLSDDAKEFLLDTGMEFNAERHLYQTHIRDSISQLQEQGLLSENPWRAPEFETTERNYLGTQIPDTIAELDREEEDRWERRLHADFRAVHAQQESEAVKRMERQQLGLFDNPESPEQEEVARPLRKLPPTPSPSPALSNDSDSDPKMEIADLFDGLDI